MGKTLRRQASADISGGAESTTPATQIEPEVHKASRLPRKMQRRQFDPVRRQASADIYGGAESTTPATQIEPEVLKVSRLPRKMQRRQFDPVRRQASADISGGAESTTPATQICENHARKMRTFFTCRLEPNVSHKVCS